MTLNLIEALELTIYNTKHTNNTNIHFQKLNFFQNQYFSKIRNGFLSACSAYLYGPVAIKYNTFKYIFSKNTTNPKMYQTNIYFRLVGNFDIDARDGVGGPFRTQTIPENHKHHKTQQNKTKQT